MASEHPYCARCGRRRREHAWDGTVCEDGELAVFVSVTAPRVGQLKRHRDWLQRQIDLGYKTRKAG